MSLEKPGKTLFVLLNHRLTPLQEEAAFKSLGVSRIEFAPTSIVERWQNIPPEAEKIEPYLEPVRLWLAAQSRKGDLVLVQGDCGACFLVALFAIASGLAPIYSTTRREAVEEPQSDGSTKVVRLFRHVAYRAYGA